MKIKFNKFFPVFLGLQMIWLAACTGDFEEINTNTNSPETIPSSLLLPTVMRTTANQVAGQAWGIGNVVMQYTAKIQFTNEDRYNWGPFGDPYESFYNAQRDISNIIKISEPQGQLNYVGIAKVIRAFQYAFMTDAYGELPYSEAINAKEGINYPVFDSQEAIYTGILNDLKEANELLGSSSESVSGDILFNGNIQNWRKLANSLRIRALMRISLRKDPGAELEEMLANPEKYPIFTGNEDHAVLQHLPDVPNQHNLYTARSGSFDEYRLSQNLEFTLKELNDPRLFAYAQPTNASGAGVIGSLNDYLGVPNGLSDEEALQFSPSGDPSKGGSNYISRVGFLWSCAACTPLANPVGYQSILMSYSELQFLLAEAREKGFISIGTAETYYLNGIHASFDYYASRYNAINLPQIAARLKVDDGYFGQDKVAYTGSKADKLYKIGNQKWIALYFSGLENWFDWRRTAIPAIKPGPAAFESMVPRRFMYPSTVQALNEENYRAAISRQGDDRITTRVWWDMPK
ncbi:SusD/RagB family nutrient-binding outer membrane lipoprotein [Anditalea andensis]|uniref:Starch-binding protein n=1 Tax=Anditalea andensis TaxID=1048983 RepID=A0A074LDW4_9BACT|nr:SusD/RagB family nutrient-binding outer membrane lipoprotein [Anditalea andensis]KEO71982.1 hypothetical protein EL17_20935 [Anditalea andensis]